MLVYWPSSITVGSAGGVVSEPTPLWFSRIASFALTTLPALSLTSTTAVLLPAPAERTQLFALLTSSQPVNARSSFANLQLPMPLSESLAEIASATTRLIVTSVLAFKTPDGLTPKIVMLALGTRLSRVMFIVVLNRLAEESFASSVNCLMPSLLLLRRLIV